MENQTPDYTVDDLFQGKSLNVRDVYNRLLTELQRFGPVKEAAKKTSIHLENKTGFAGIHPRSRYINLVIRSNVEIDSPRVQASEKVSKNRFHHTLRLESEDEIDQELLSWLQAAYQLSA